MKRFLIIIIAILVTSLLAIALIYSPKLQTTPTNKLNVVATFYPLAYLAEQVGGEYIELTTIVPPGVEPHDFTPTPSDIRKVTEADVVLYNGGGLDTWVTNIPTADYQDGEVTLIHLAEPNQDPHAWLDPVAIQPIVGALRDALVERDPVHADYYQANAAELKNHLQQLDVSYQERLSNCQLHTIITAHDAFSYLAKRYNFTVESIVGLNPNETPSAKTISELVTLVQQQGIRTIFFEELTNPKLSEVLAAEAGVNTSVLSPIEGLAPEEAKAGEDYFTISQQNLEQLAVAMQCL